MPRNTDLSSHNLLRSEPLLQTTSHVTGPFSFLNPTNAHVHDDSAKSKGGSEKSHVRFKWSSRNNRKGRHGLILSPSLDASATPTPAASSAPSEIAQGVLRMATEYPYWDVSWLVATVFTLGSVVWVINGCFVFLPFIAPSATFHNESFVGGGVSAFIGATIFEFGSVLLMIEAVNENRADCFGWAIEQALGQDCEKGPALQITKRQCNHHHANKCNFVGSGPTRQSSGASVSDSADSSPAPMKSESRAPQEEKAQVWIWWPSSTELRGHYLHELGFLACLSQMFGASVFWISGFTALPGILNKMSPGLVDGIYWTPQVIGGSGFIVSGVLFMLETQERWYKPALRTLGWHIGFHNLVGGIGFTLSPCFGYDTHSWAQYQAACTTFWASFFFLIGSVLQWYESQSKHPVEVAKLDP